MALKRSRRIAVAMSGGVDSSVAAALLVREGYEVFGVTLRLAEEGAGEGGEGPGSAPAYLEDARRVAAALDIPFHAIDAREPFRRLVVEPFAREYLRGKTPNPCIRCNRRIKFGLLLDEARARGADCVATGHYARIGHDPATGRSRLVRGVDPGKDQSYFLFDLTQDQLRHSLFPLGGLTKAAARQLAAQWDLPVARKRESQEICFIPSGSYAAFVADRVSAEATAGEIVDGQGRVLGRHDGYHRFTVGQRRGIGIAAPQPLYVLRVDAARQQVVVGPQEELRAEGLVAAQVNWIGAPPEGELRALAQIRYRSSPVPARIVDRGGGRVAVRFEAPVRAVAPGQAVVFYQDDVVLGGGWIAAE